MIKIFLKVNCQPGTSGLKSFFLKTKIG